MVSFFTFIFAVLLFIFVVLLHLIIYKTSYSYFVSNFVAMTTIVVPVKI